MIRDINDVNRYLEYVKNSFSNINSTTIPGVFFKELNRLRRILTELADSEKRFIYNVLPSDDLKKLNRSRDKRINDFIRRVSENVMNIEMLFMILKESRQNKLDKYFTEIYKYKSNFSDVNIEFLDMIREECENDFRNNFKITLMDFMPVIIDEENPNKII